jgi:8-oxo-dGTP pyrophosphatase MutT (NUDIX family)
MAAGALFVNERGQILLVHPTYRPDWLLPGGSVDADESPHVCAIREVREELGLDVRVGRLLCLEYHARIGPKTESLQFIFDGGTLSAEQIMQVTLPADELSEWRWVALEDARELLSGYMFTRVSCALEAYHSGQTIYLENQLQITNYE